MIIMDQTSATDLVNILQYLVTENEGKIEESIKSCGNIRKVGLEFFNFKISIKNFR